MSMFTSHRRYLFTCEIHCKASDVEFTSVGVTSHSNDSFPVKCTYLKCKAKLTPAHPKHLFLSDLYEMLCQRTILFQSTVSYFSVICHMENH